MPEIDYSEVAGRTVECLPQCGMCCLCQPEVLPQERQYFRSQHPGALVRSRSEDGHFALAMKKGRGSCVFLEGRRCAVYQHRTTYCRQFPFHFYASDRVRVELDLSCRGVWTGRGADAAAEARALAEASSARIEAALRQSAPVYREFYSLCAEAGVMADPSELRMAVSENISKFADLAHLSAVMDASMEDPVMDLGSVAGAARVDMEDLEAAAREAAGGSMGSRDPMDLPVYCDPRWNWNMFTMDGSRVGWSVMDDSGDLHAKASADASEIRLREPDADGRRVLLDYVGTLNGRDSFLGSVFHTMDELGYEDSMANAYFGSMAVAVIDVLWRASLLDRFMGTGMGADGIREAVIFYDMDRLDAPAIGAFARRPGPLPQNRYVQIVNEIWACRWLKMNKPLSVLQASAGKNVIVELKGRREYRGVLDGYDPHMNLVLRKAEELVDGASVRKLSTVIVRGDNVIYISP